MANFQTSTRTTPLVVGKGQMFFAPCPEGVDARLIDNYEPIGNVPGLNITFETEVLQHFDSQGGIQTQDDSVDLRVTSSGSFNTDAISARNLARFLFGETTTTTQVAAPVADEQKTAIQPGAFIQLGRSISNPTGVRGIENVVVKQAAGAIDPGVNDAFVLGTDYRVSAQSGLIEVIEGGNIPVGAPFFVDYTLKAQTREQTVSGRLIARGAIQFIEDNVRGANKVWFFPNAVIRPDGDFNLITDEFESLPYQIELLTLGDLERAYIDGAPFVA